MNITENYKQQLKELHSLKTFGANSTIPEEVLRCIRDYNIASILDFGCGKGNMVANLEKQFPSLKIYGYDPTSENHNVFPGHNIDMIYSTDVLEHVEPSALDTTLHFLANKTLKVMHHLIACHPAKKKLNDGRNAHLIIEHPKWWAEKFKIIPGWKITKDYTTEWNKKTKNSILHVIKYHVTLEKIL